jgi:low affinity Fe/Cu permease
MKNKKQSGSNAFEKFATHVSKAAGSTTAFIGAFLIVVAWAASGPVFNYSETWQLVINTGTTIITFLMVFLIQKAQNKDSLAIQLKLNELVASNELSSNSLVDIESMTEEEMIIVQKYYQRLSELAKKDESIRTSHSIAEAHQQHERKDKNRNTQKNAKIKPITKSNIKPNKKITKKPTETDRNTAKK